MKSKLIGSLFIIVTLVVGIVAFAPSAFAQSTASVTVKQGAGTEGCEKDESCYQPYNVSVDVGGTVTWTNTDTTANSVTSGTPKPDNSTGSVFDSGFLGPGKTFSHTFTAADVGTINYFSEIHPWMAGQVIVTASGKTPSTSTETPNATNNNAIPEFGPIASLVLVIAIVSVVAVTAKTRVFLKL